MHIHVFNRDPGFVIFALYMDDVILLDANKKVVNKL